jgi:hypothetical protein
MTDCTTTIESTFQVLDVIISPPPGTNPLAYVETGLTNLPMSQQTTAVVFQVQKVSAWTLVEGEIVNTMDATPINFSWELTAYPLTGFTVKLSGLPDTNNYYFRWRVGVPPS